MEWAGSGNAHRGSATDQAERPTARGLEGLVARWGGFSHVSAGLTAHALERISEPQINLAVWLRRFPPPLTAWLDRLPGTDFPKGRAVLDAPQSRPALERLVGADGMPVTGERDSVLQDCAELIGLFARLADTKRVCVRLDALGCDGMALGCQSFHVDYVPLRMIVAYRGSGTQWLPAPIADHARLDGDTPADREIETVPRYAVALFKGQAARKARPLVHRSPPLEPGDIRFFMCLTVPRS